GADHDGDPPGDGVNRGVDHLAELGVGQRRGLSGRAADEQAVDAAGDLVLDQGAEGGEVKGVAVEGGDEGGPGTVEAGGDRLVERGDHGWAAPLGVFRWVMRVPNPSTSLRRPGPRCPG